VQAYAIDMETNTLQERVFHVKHVRFSKAGMQRLTDPRDIYEMIANLAARRIRACILSLIPGDVQEAALAQCEETLKGGGGKPLKDRIKAMLAKFKELSVSQEMIEARYRKKAEAIDEIQLLDLIRIHNSLRDGMSNLEDWFSDENQSVKDTLSKSRLKREAVQKGAGSRKAAEGPPAGTEPEPSTEAAPAVENGQSERRGRISAEEDKEFSDAVDRLVSRAWNTGRDTAFVKRVYERIAAGYGGMQGPEQIRSREMRDKFLKDFGDMVEQWEKNPTTNDLGGV